VRPPRFHSFHKTVYEVVSLVPYGRVTTYGAVAAILGSPRLAHAVGFALHALPPDTDVPWHRVINSLGRISFRGDDIRGMEQERRLLEEGIEFGPDGSVDLRRFGWMVLSGL